MFKEFTLNIRGRLRVFTSPVVMGIINATPDSFFASSRHNATADIARVADGMIASGAEMIDLGACSSRPGAADVTPGEEVERLLPAIGAVRGVSDDVIISVDTYRADVARCAVEAGADIVNDISGCSLDPGMADTVASLKVPYILMHMRGTPATMQQLTDYPAGVTAGVMAELSGIYHRLCLAGVSDIIIDPGLGFAKTLEQNYTLLHDIGLLADAFHCPVLVGASRKSMVTRLLDISAEQALNATTVINTIALMEGASILRVHDVDEAVQAVRVVEMYSNANCIE